MILLSKEINKILKDAENKIQDLIKSQSNISLDLTEPNIGNFHAFANIICEALDVDTCPVFNKNKKSVFIDAKYLIIWFITRRFGRQDNQLADFFNIDRTTIINALKVIQGRIDIKESNTLESIKKIERKLEIYGGDSCLKQIYNFKQQRKKRRFNNEVST